MFHRITLLALTNPLQLHQSWGVSAWVGP